ncbi:hypothetical protein GCM10025776_27470 [Corallincola platygyrae]
MAMAVTTLVTIVRRELGTLADGVPFNVPFWHFFIYFVLVEMISLIMLQA